MSQSDTECFLSLSAAVLSPLKGDCTLHSLGATVWGMWILNHSPVVLFSKSFDKEASVRSSLDLQLEAITAAGNIKSDGKKGGGGGVANSMRWQAKHDNTWKQTVITTSRWLRGQHPDFNCYVSLSRCPVIRCSEGLIRFLVWPLEESKSFFLWYSNGT